MEVDDARYVIELILLVVGQLHAVALERHGEMMFGFFKSFLRILCNLWGATLETTLFVGEGDDGRQSLARPEVLSGSTATDRR